MSKAIKANESLPATRQDDQVSAIISVIERAATNPEVDVEKMESLLDMQERVFNRSAESSYNIAMSQAQSQMRQVSTDAANPQTRSRYASYSALDKALRPIYTSNQFSLSFDTGEGAPEGWMRVVCYVSHNSGHSRTYHIDMPADGKGAKGGDVMTKTHAAGSAMSYGMRYLLKLIFNVAIGEDDDDGNAADDAEKERILANMRHNFASIKVAAIRKHLDTVKIIIDALREYQKSTDEEDKKEILYIAAEAYWELTNDEKSEILIAPSKGGIFTTAEREIIKSREFRTVYYGEGASYELNKEEST